MKKILSLFFIALLLLSGCTKKETPEDILKNAYAKMDDLDSYTMDGTMTYEMGGISLPLTYKTSVLRHDKSDESDDEVYMEVLMDVLYEQMTMKSWTKDGKVTIYDGKSVTESETDTSSTSALFSDPGALSKLIFDNIEKSSMEKDGDDTIITLTMKEDFAKTYLNAFGSEGLGDSLENVTLGDLILTVNKDGYVANTHLEMETEVEGQSAKISTDLSMTDINSAVIPEIDPSYYETGTDDTEADPQNYIDIMFEDGIEVYFLVGEDSGYTIDYSEDDTLIEIYDPEGVYAAEGFFVSKTFADEIIDSVSSEEEGAIENLESDLNFGVEGRSVRGFSKEETEFFNAGTPFLVVSFKEESYDLGVAIVGYENYENFKKMSDHFSFMVFTDPQ
ncbi:MAG: hypothetical protein IIZ33_01365 [Erysipelotrichaceae bacterium]|nr:hypothetical protein [Erysipelotrichaceae bacterium]